jgi:DNA ligase-1
METLFIKNLIVCVDYQATQWHPITMNETQMTLGRDWDGRDVSGWLASEKYDGCRAYWDGSTLWTRDGNVICAPKWFTDGLPATHIDGEIWAGRGKFEEAKAAVQQGTFTDSIRFMAFDAPQASGDWACRMATIPATMTMEPVQYFAVTNVEQMREMFATVKQGGGEGLMLRDTRCTMYEYGRTNKLLKVKK